MGGFPRRQVKGQAGITLIELVVALAMLALMLVAVFGVWSHTQQTYFFGSEAGEMAQGARVAMEQMAREIKLAGYDPCRYVPNPLPANPSPPPATVSSTCAAPPSATPPWNNRSAFDPVRSGTFAIMTNPLSATQIRVLADRNANGNAQDADATNLVYEDVSFRLNGTTLQRSTDGGTTWVELAQNIQSLAFGYFDGTGAATTDRNAVRLVRISLTAQEHLGPALPQNLITVTLASDVRLRDR